MKRCYFKLLLSFILFSSNGYSESSIVYPEVGKICPDFLLRNVKYYFQKEVCLQDFKGKWLILDFWNKACGSCIASFPKTSALQKKYFDKVQFMLVGIEDKEGQIEPMYAKFREKLHLLMPCAFDSMLAKKWDIFSTPYIIVVDPLGMVKVITYSISDEDLQNLFEGKTPLLPKVFRMHEKEVDTKTPYNPTYPFLINGNGGVDSIFMFRSVLSSFDAFNQHFLLPATIEDGLENGRFEVLGAPLYFLYNYAYYGAMHPDSGFRDHPILDIKNSSTFQFSEKYSKNLFAYSLIVPKSQLSKARVQEMMKRDLENYFGYVVTVENRRFPCLKLVASKKVRKKVRSGGGVEKFQFILLKAEFIAQNCPFSRIVDLLGAFNGAEIIDKTGITGNVDIHMSCLLTDLEDVKRELQFHGFKLIPAQKLLKVLVIKDKP